MHSAPTTALSLPVAETSALSLCAPVELAVASGTTARLAPDNTRDALWLPKGGQRNPFGSEFPGDGYFEDGYFEEFAECMATREKREALCDKAWSGRLTIRDTRALVSLLETWSRGDAENICEDAQRQQARHFADHLEWRWL